MLHRENKATRLDATQGRGKPTAVPNEVADEVGTDSPSAKDEPALTVLE
jgi:hypothetical protein